MKSLRVAALFSVLIMSQSCSAQFGPTDAGEVEAVSQDEIYERNLIVNRVSQAIEAKDYAALDAMELEYRTSRSRTPSGIWKLAGLHAVLQANLAEGLTREDGCAMRQDSFVKEWRQARPNSPAAIITEAELLARQAWCIRGGDFAVNVPASAWEPVHERIAQAGDLLAEKYEVASVDPEYYAVMSGIFRSQGVDRISLMVMLNEATDREPYYHRTYFNAALSFLPQWGGSNEELDTFARYAADKTAAGEGMGFYARVYWSLTECGCYDIRTQTDWDSMKEGMRDAYERYPVPFNGQFFSDLSCERGDLDEGLHYIRAMHPEATSDDDLVALVQTCKNAAM